MKQVKVNDIKVVYKDLTKHDVWGYADMRKNIIELHKTLKGYRLLLYTLHELLHLLHPDWSETRVRKESSKTAKFLWKNGFRWVDN